MQIYIPDKKQHLRRKINWAGISGLTPYVSTESSTTIELNSQETAVVQSSFSFFMTRSA